MLLANAFTNVQLKHNLIVKYYRENVQSASCGQVVFHPDAKQRVLHRLKEFYFAIMTGWLHNIPLNALPPAT